MRARCPSTIKQTSVGLGAAIAVLLGCAASAAGAQHVAPAHYAHGPATASLRGLVDAMGGNAADAADASHAYLRKLDSHLQEIAAARLEHDDLTATADREALALSPDERRVQVDVYVNGDMTGALDALRAAGMDVTAVSNRAPQRMVEGTLPISALTSVAGLGSTHAVLAVQGSDTNTGSVLSQGDAAHRGPQARAFGPTGAGVTVGVISNSINRAGGGIAGSQATGDLPGPASSPPGQVQVLLDGSSGSSDEGRAMAEIIFDEAPGIRNMLFTTGLLGAATRASGIDNLASAGAKVIADDTVQLTEPFFQDGVIAQAVDRARAAGVTYLVSAGNRARQSWEGTYAAMTDPRGVSPSTTDFDPGPASDAVQTIGTFSGVRMFVSLQWDEPYGNATTDLALDVYAGGVFLGTVDSDNIATGIPSEFASITIPGTDTIGIAIRRKSGTHDPFIKYIVGGVPRFTIAEHDTSSNAIDPDASSARGALTVAASPFGTIATPESFSSRGPAFKLFDVDGNRLAAPDVRPKPDLAAADGVATSVSGFNPFFGTSAAAPSAAGIAALILSARPSLSADAVAAILKDPARTVDCSVTLGLPDPDCGFGFVLADGAVSAALDTTPPTVTPVITPSADGASGWYTSAVPSISWAVTDAGSPILSRTGCDPGSVTTDATVAFACSATSIGGATGQSVTLKRDGSPPTRPSFSGISARHYTVGRAPRASSVRCQASDATSGVASCVVSGYSTRQGRHTITATATNGAGLRTTAKLTYTVSPPLAISALRAAKSRLAIASILSHGVGASLRAAGRRTRLKATLIAGRHVVATLERTVKAGKVSLHLDVSANGRSQLQRAAGPLKLKVTGSARGFTTTTLTATIRTR